VEQGDQDESDDSRGWWASWPMAGLVIAGAVVVVVLLIGLCLVMFVDLFAEFD
jgi:hypothetical protein